MHISKLELKDIGVFDHLVIEFGRKLRADLADIHILTGINGTGKSTILYALSGAIDDYSIIKRFRNENSYISVHYEQKDKTPFAVTLHSHERSNDTNEIKMYWQIHTRQKDINKEPLDFLFVGYSGYRTITSEKIESIKEINEHPLSSTLRFDRPTDSRLILQWIANTKAKIAFSYQEGKTEDAKKYEESIKKIESSIEQITGCEVKFIFHYKTMEVKIKINKDELEFDLLPDGLKSIISWIADLLILLDRVPWKDDMDILDRNLILFLDEIEVHLHPAWQRKILPVIQKLFKNAQIFIATHSPFVAGSVEHAWIYKLDIENGAGVLKERIETQAGKSYPSIIDNIFGIDEYFDVETECQLDRFYNLRSELLNGNMHNYDEFVALARELAEKSVEVRDIIGRELRQFSRITGKEVLL
ncbi:MAG: AAA family ATPase [Candidatus Eremiobacterota bacterium]